MFGIHQKIQCSFRFCFHYTTIGKGYEYYQKNKPTYFRRNFQEKPCQGLWVFNPSGDRNIKVTRRGTEQSPNLGSIVHKQENSGTAPEKHQQEASCPLLKTSYPMCMPLI
jgi:hypothetical protein